jgi:uncharacterized LabA/DUF88 family protein
MAEFVYVDNSNVFIEAQRVSAVSKSMAMNMYDAMKNKVLYPSYRLDFGKLHSFVAGNDPSKIKRAMLFGSRPPRNDSLWRIAASVGFEPIIEDRNAQNKEKRIDTGIVAAMTKDAYTQVDKAADTITLVGGDGDYVPPVRQLVQDGYEVKVVFWGHASGELQNTGCKFVCLDEHLSRLSFP